MASPLGIIAGKGQLPIDVAKSLTSRGEAFYVLRIDGSTDQALQAFPGTDFNMGGVGKAMTLLAQAGCKRIVFVGYITRPDLARVEFDDVGTKMLPEIMAAAQEGDDAIMGVFLSAFREKGFEVLGAEEVYTDLLCPEGVLTNAEPDLQAKKDLAKGADIAALIGARDIGQGCVVCDGLVLAVEAQEGTDKMLARIPELDASFRGTLQARRGVLVKRAKPGQERRVDLPAIGPDTISAARAAGLAGIGLEAGGSLIIDREATVRAANSAGLFIIGLSGDELG